MISRKYSDFPRVFTIIG